MILKFFSFGFFIMLAFPSQVKGEAMRDYIKSIESRKPILLEEVQKILDSGGDPNAFSLETNKTLLHLASWKGDKDVIQLLLKWGANINSQSRYLYTPLLNAISGRKYDTALFLLKNGADPTLKDHERLNAFQWAVIRENTAFANTVLQATVDYWNRNNRKTKTRKDFINDTNIYGGSPLHEAAEDGDAETVSWLLAEGANVHAKDLSGYNPLHEVIEELEDDEDDEDLLKVLTILIQEGGADPRIPDGRGRKPIYWALDNHQYYQNNESLKILNILKSNITESQMLAMEEQREEYEERLETKREQRLFGDIVDINGYIDYWDSIEKEQCQKREKMNFLQRLPSSLNEHGDSCLMSGIILAVLKNEKAWIEKAESRGFTINNIDPVASGTYLKGSIFLNKAHSSSIKVSREWSDCFFFPCFKNGVSIFIAGKNIFYPHCSGSDENSGCFALAKKWQEKLKQGYEMELQFFRSILDKVASLPGINLTAEYAPYYNLKYVSFH